MHYQLNIEASAPTLREALAAAHDILARGSDGGPALGDVDHFSVGHNDADRGVRAVFVAESESDDRDGDGDGDADDHVVELQSSRDFVAPDDEEHGDGFVYHPDADILPAIDRQPWMPGEAHYVARNEKPSVGEDHPRVHFFAELPKYKFGLAQSRCGGHWVTDSGAVYSVLANQFDPAADMSARYSLRRIS